MTKRKVKAKVKHVVIKLKPHELGAIEKAYNYLGRVYAAIKKTK